MAEPTPPNPYDPRYLLENLEVDANIIDYIQAHPIAAGLIALVLIVFVFWFIGRRRRKEPEP
jgi:membrane protein DedA with SNARE-associated domain